MKIEIRDHGTKLYSIWYSEYNHFELEEYLIRLWSEMLKRSSVAHFAARHKATDDDIPEEFSFSDNNEIQFKFLKNPEDEYDFSLVIWAWWRFQQPRLLYFNELVELPEYMSKPEDITIQEQASFIVFKLIEEDVIWIRIPNRIDFDLVDLCLRLARD